MRFRKETGPPKAVRLHQRWAFASEKGNASPRRLTSLVRRRGRIVPLQRRPDGPKSRVSLPLEIGIPGAIISAGFHDDEVVFGIHEDELEVDSLRGICAVIGERPPLISVAE